MAVVLYLGSREAGVPSDESTELLGLCIGCQSCSLIGSSVTTFGFCFWEGGKGARRAGGDKSGDLALGVALLDSGDRAVAIGGGVAPCSVMEELVDGGAGEATVDGGSAKR